MKTLSLIFICALLGLASAGNVWTKTNEEVLDNHHVTFKVAMKIQNQETLDRLFYEVNDPNSPFYGQFLSNEQIADVIAQPEENIRAVEEFLTARSGEACEVIARRSIHKDYIFVDTCASQAQLIFPNLSLAVYEESAGHKELRHESLVDIEHNLYLLGVPANLHEYILAIHDVTDTPVVATRHSNLYSPGEAWEPSDKELTVGEMNEYFKMNFSDVSSATLNSDHPQVKAAVIEFGGAAFSASELKQFQKKYHVPLNAIRKVVGSEETYSYSTEASLDVQSLTAIGQNVQTWDFVFGNNFDFIPVVETLMSTKGAPLITSLSYGEPETLFGESKVKANNTSFQKLGLAGHTFLAASGDSGPTLNPSHCSEFVGQYPSASPFILSIGGNAIDKQTGKIHAWVNSSGGFSVFSEQPSYQKAHVQHYLKTASSLPDNSNGKNYDTSKRAYPDVSGFGAFEPVLSNGSYQPVGGTSGSCPQFAGVLALINAYRYQNKLGPLGAVAQTLYSLKSVGTDVVLGQTYATSRDGCYGQYLPGFKAAAGWDPATGLGSPVWSVLKVGLGDIKAKVPAPSHHHGDHHGDHHGHDGHDGHKEHHGHGKQHQRNHHHDDEFLPLN